MKSNSNDIQFIKLTLQSDRPSQTKNQLMQIPDERHWNVPSAHPELRAEHSKEIAESFIA